MMQTWSKRHLRSTRPIRKAKLGCSRLGSTATASWSRRVVSNSATSWFCSTPLRCRACLPRHCELGALGRILGLRRCSSSPDLAVGRAVFGDRRQTPRLRVDTAAAVNILVDVDLTDDWPCVALDIEPKAKHQPLLAR